MRIAVNMIFTVHGNLKICTCGKKRRAFDDWDKMREPSDNSHARETFLLENWVWDPC